MVKLGLGLLVVLLGMCAVPIRSDCEECRTDDACYVFFKEGGLFDEKCGQFKEPRILKKWQKRCGNQATSNLFDFFCSIINKCNRRGQRGVMPPQLETCSGDAFGWCYLDPECQPSVWPLYFPACFGENQSPIDIVDQDTEYKPFEDFEFIRFDEWDGVNYLLKNTGHNVEVEIELSGAGVGSHQITGGGLSGTYQLVQFHFHWGSNSDQGSEHTRNGEHFPMEVHLVSYNTAYADISEALGHEDGLAVIGAFFAIGFEENTSLFQEIVSKLPFVPNDGDTFELEGHPILEFLPNCKRLFRYAGSLTTPGCAEVVTWSVLANPIYISAAQMEAFRSGLFDDHGGPLVDNYRPVQDLGDRTVYKSFQ